MWKMHPPVKNCEVNHTNLRVPNERQIGLDNHTDNEVGACRSPAGPTLGGALSETWSPPYVARNIFLRFLCVQLDSENVALWKTFASSRPPVRNLSFLHVPIRSLFLHFYVVFLVQVDHEYRSRVEPNACENGGEVCKLPR